LLPLRNVQALPAPLGDLVVPGGCVSNRRQIVSSSGL